MTQNNGSCKVCGGPMPARKRGEPGRLCTVTCRSTECRQEWARRKNREYKAGKRRKAKPTDTLDGFKVGDRVYDPKTAYPHRNAGTVVDLIPEYVCLRVQRDCDGEGHRIAMYVGNVEKIRCTSA